MKGSKESVSTANMVSMDISKRYGVIAACGDGHLAGFLP